MITVTLRASSEVDSPRITLVGDDVDELIARIRNPAELLVHRPRDSQHRYLGDAPHLLRLP